jgi:cytochrome c-type biogenesis protein CcmH
MVDWLFWLIAGLVAVTSLGLALAPLWRGAGRAERRASYDLQLLRDQLREIEADRARGVLGLEEAAASRAEVSRRLIAAADAEAAEPPAATAPPRLSRPAAALVGGLGLAAAAGLYLAIGAPGLPDRPRAARAERPDQAAAEALAARRQPPPPPTADDPLIERLRAALAERPEDVEGRRLLARSLAATGRWPEARAAQAEVVALLGEAAAAQDLVDLAELGIMAAGGYVSPESEAALARTLDLDPAHPAGRYYSGLALMQAGRPDLAHAVFAALLAEGPADAPWIEAVRAGLAEAARQAGLAPRPDAPGPGAADLEAAAAMTPEERQAMIEGMVASLGQRLAADGGPPEDWARLIRALGVLGRRDEAAEIAAEARAAHAGDAAGLAAIEAASREAGVGP